MARLPVAVDPSDDVLVGSVVAGVVYHRPAGHGSACGVPAKVLLPPVGAYRVVALCGSPCPVCWPDPYGLAALNRPYRSAAGVRDLNSSVASRGLPARVRADAHCS
jgi:hypothetical protein